VSFDLNVFCQKLVSALDRDGTDLGRSCAKGKPFSAAVPERVRAQSDLGQSDFGIEYLLSELLSKYDDGSPSPEKDEATWARFYEAEEMCCSANARLSGATNIRLTAGVGVESVLFHAQRKIGALLGEFTWDEASAGFDWGPGATFRLKRASADPALKYQGFPETTPENFVLAHAAIAAVPAWSAGLRSEGGGLEIVPGNKVITVPKNWKTNRVIAVEPRMNMYIQKGIGSMIRRRLQRVGIDLNDQSRNRRLAVEGSLSGHLATIDLSMASDTVSLELVRNLLPPPWVEALEQCRSTRGVLPSGEWIVYQKFSSMGNGYTFELESLIFWGLIQGLATALGLTDVDVSVYGDDLIVPVRLVAPLVELFDHCGFRVNEKKSFSEGPFRESCGIHAFLGNDVTPFYIRRPIKRLLDLFLLHNNLSRWLSRGHWNSGINQREMYNLLLWLRSHAPKRWVKPRICDGFGDGAFIGTFDEVNPSIAHRGLEGFQCEVLVEVTPSVEIDSFGRLCKSLRSVSRTRSALDFLVDPREMRGGVSGRPRYKTVKVLVPQFSLLLNVS
jgi:hypothetical protein